MSKHKKIKIIVVSLLLIVCSLAVIHTASASVDHPRGSLKISSQYDSSITRFSDANTFLTSLVDFFLKFVAIIAIAAIIYGGFLMLTSRGEEEVHKKGIKVIMYAVIGIVVILASYAIVNTIINFGTGTEGVSSNTSTETDDGDGGFNLNIDWPGGGSQGVGSVPGDERSGSDDFNKIRAELNVTPTAGTLPMIATFNSEGSYDLSSNPFSKNDFYWDFDDGSKIMGTIMKSGDKTVFKLNDSGSAIPVIAKTNLVDSFGGIDNYCSSSESENICLKIDNDPIEYNHFANAVKNAQDLYQGIGQYIESVAEQTGQFPEELFGWNIQNANKMKQILVNGNAIVGAMAASDTYHVYLYGRKRKATQNDIDNAEKLTDTDVEQGEGIIEILNPGTDGYVATIVNPYGMNLGYVQEHRYVKDGNFSPTLQVVNDQGSPFQPIGDLRAYKSVLVQVSRDNIDPNRVPPTSAYVYNFDPDDPKKVIFKDMSLTDQGTPISELLADTTYPLDLDPNTDSDNDGSSINDNNTFVSEWDFDLSLDTSGDSNPANDSEYGISGISGISTEVNSRNLSVTWKDIFNDEEPIETERYSWQSREAGSDVYHDEGITSTSNGTGLTATINVPSTPGKISYYRFKTDDGRVSPEVKVKVEDGSVEVMNADTINDEHIYHVYSKKTNKVRVKLMTKNLVTQDYDNVVREISLPYKPATPEIPPTALFTYQVKPGTKQVYIYNVSFGANSESSLTYSGNNYTIGKDQDNKQYEFEWDFDTRTEIDKLLIQPVTNELIDEDNHITTEGTVSASDTANTYLNDSITDNDINTKFGGLTSSSVDGYNGMIIDFPEDQKTYSVKLTVTDQNNSELSDSKMINIYVPKIPEPLPPVAAFTWNMPNDTTIKIDNTSMIYDIDSQEYVELVEGYNHELKWDFDIDLDTNGDGDSENDYETEMAFSSFIVDFKTLLGEDYEYGSHRVKLIVKNPDTLKEDPIFHTVIKPRPEEIENFIFPPVAAFMYSYDNIANVQMLNNSLGIDHNLLSEAEQADFNNYEFIWDKDLNTDSDGDGTFDNDNDLFVDGDIFEPVFAYDNFGTYNVKLTVTYDDPNSDKTSTDYVIRRVHLYSNAVIPTENKPIAAFTFRQDQDNDHEVSFTNHSIDTAANPITNITWDYDTSFDSNGDGNGGNDEDQIGDNNDSFTVVDENLVLYKQYKTYRVKLTARKDNLTDTVSRTVELGSLQSQLPPLPLYIYSKNGQTIKFINRSQTGFGQTIPRDAACSENQSPTTHSCYEFKWFFDAENYNGGQGEPDYTGFGPEIQHAYDNYGTHQAYLLITDPFGNTESMSRDIQIADTASTNTIHANIVAIPKSGTSPLTVVFSSKGSKDDLGSIEQIYWDFDGDGTPDEHSDIVGDTYTTVTHTYNSPGHYRAGLAVQGSDGNKAIAFTWIDVYGEPPTAKIFIDEDEFANEDIAEDYISFVNTNIDFKAFIEDPGATFVSPGNYVYKWDFGDSYYSPDNNQSEQINASHTYTNPGTYKVSFYVKNTTSNLSSITERNVNIYPAPPIAKIIAKSLDHTIESLSDQKFFAGALDIDNNRFDVEFLANDSEGAPITNQPNSELTELTTFHWDFGDGNDTTEVFKDTPVVHGFTHPGTYNVVLTITDEKNVTDTESKIVFIADNREPVPHVQIRPPRARTGQLITLDATGSHSTNGPIVEYTWEIGQRPFTQANPGIKLFSKISRYAFEKPSQVNNPYDISLTIKDNIGKVQTVYLDDSLIIDSKAPTAKLTFSQDDQNVPNKILFDASDSFDNDPDDTLTYTWYFGDETDPVSTDIPVTSHIYGEKGRFFARVEVTDSANLKSTAEVVVRIDSLLRSNILEVFPRAGKAPLEVDFNGTGGYTRILDNEIYIDDSVVINYEWNFDDGTIINGTDKTTPTHTFTEGGKHYVKLTVYDIEDESASFEKVVYVGSPDPGPIAIIDGQGFEGYRNVPINFNGFDSLTPAEVPDSDDGVMDLEYSWDFDDDSGIVTGESNPIHVYNGTGTYRVTLTVTDIMGRTSRDDIRIKIIKAKPHARFTASPSYGESELLVEFDASSSSDPDNNINHYIWKFTSDVTLSTTEPEISYPFINNSDEPETYNVLLKVIDEDDLYDTYSLPITVLPNEQ